MEIGKFVDDAIWKLRITQKELGRRLGKSPKTIYNWINGIGEPRASEYEEIKKMVKDQTNE
ncbi:helix-turn-helix transcriptional regulator [Candidatus Pacearchaeota archaeon]|nr:helix-turn-helix transcriptional regulator [Candidatus Pacearchaeota archaeon]